MFYSDGAVLAGVHMYAELGMELECIVQCTSV